MVSTKAVEIIVRVDEPVNLVAGERVIGCAMTPVHRDERATCGKSSGGLAHCAVEVASVEVIADLGEHDEVSFLVGPIIEAALRAVSRLRASP